MFHVTERLLLRPTWPEDWSAVLDGIADEAIVRNLARVPWPYTEADARWWTARGQDSTLPNFAVIESRTGALIGASGVHLADGGDDIELGYWFARASWGRGYATEAARAVIEVVRMMGFRRVLAGHFADNPASGRVIRKLGFRPVGTARRFSLARGGEVDSVEFALDLDAPCTMPCAA